MMPKVSIIMATYNRAHYIEETLRSIIAQTFRDWECLIIDDGGTDNTVEVLAPILSGDKRIQYHKRPDQYQKGLPGSRNYGLDLAKGDYVIFFDDDDIVHPLNLQLTVGQLEKSDYDFCRYIRKAFEGDFEYKFDMAETFTSFEIGSHDLEKMIKGDIPFNSCAVLWSRRCFKDNRFIEHLQYAEEWELYSRILSHGFWGISIDKNLFFGRKHPASNTGEFYSGNDKRRKSMSDAIVLIAQNLANRQLLEYSIKRYLITLAFNYQDYHVFERIASLEPRLGYRLYWRYFYQILPIRFFITAKLKNLRKKKAKISGN